MDFLPSTRFSSIIAIKSITVTIDMCATFIEYSKKYKKEKKFVIKWVLPSYKSV